MAQLKEISQDAQNIAEAIASVIGVHVTIVDKQFLRIAATGEYYDTVGQYVANRTVFHLALENRKSYIVSEPKKENVCLDCDNKENCLEFAEVCTPIEFKDKAYGVIGLVAFSYDQKEKLLFDIDNLMDFLQRMADLIAIKLLEKEKTDQLQLLTNRMTTIINSIDEGIISTDEKGLIKQYNQTAQVLFKLDQFPEPISIQEFIADYHSLTLDISRGQTIKNRDFLYQYKNYIVRGTYTINVVLMNDQLTGMVFMIREISQVYQAVTDALATGYDTSFDLIIGENRQLEDLKQRSLRAANSSSTVLIQGESGTGKELFARAIHSSSQRRNKPFIVINCAAIPEHLLESELFGYEEGAFTGAVRGGKPGKFELANNGSIFLDEIGDMSLHLQAKLLRVIQEKKIDRIGSKAPIPLDVRIIAATNADLEQKVSLKEFRQDLFFRLNVIPLWIPPLRERKEDIPILMDHLLRKCNQKLSKNILGFSMEVINHFSKYNWQGNVRELENVIEYAVNMEQENIITLASLPLRMKQEKASLPKKTDNEVIPLAEMEKEAIQNALAIYKNRDQAAETLGIGRATLYRKIKKYCL